MVCVLVWGIGGSVILGGVVFLALFLFFGPKIMYPDRKEATTVYLGNLGKPAKPADRPILSLMVEYDNRIAAILRSMETNNFMHHDLEKALAMVRQTLRQAINAERQKNEEGG